MRRTKTPFRIPDSINLTISDSFTQIPNSVLRDSRLSAKAKGILCLLLSNKEGWQSHITTICAMMKDGERSIRSGLQELEKQEYLCRIQYKDEKTKQFRGVFWGYTDISGQFDFEKLHEYLAKFSYVIDFSKDKKDATNAQHNPGWLKPACGKPACGKQQANNTNYKNTNSKKKKNGENSEFAFKLEIDEKERKVISSQFEQFWSMYPKKIDKGRAKSAWLKLTKKNVKDRPTWNEIITAIAAQKNSPRWQNSKYIPHAATWINQQRWIDIPEEMISYDTTQQQRPMTKKEISIMIKKNFGELQHAFKNSCFVPAISIFPDMSEDLLLENLIKLNNDIKQKQSKSKIENSLPGSITLMQEYLDWLVENDWIRDKSSNLLKIDNSLFLRFCNEQAQLDNMKRHPLTGQIKL